MSSYYTTAQLEEMRKAKLKRQLNESIQKLAALLQEKHENTGQISFKSNIKISVLESDESINGYDTNTVITGEMMRKGEKQEQIEHTVLDLSQLLYSSYKKPTGLERELDLWICKVDERPVITEKDEKDHIRLLEELERITVDETLDIEDKIKLVKMRVLSYLQGAVQMTPGDEEKIKSSYYEYCALCEMLDMKPIERLPYRIQNEVVRMIAVLEKRKQDEYVMDVIESIMGELGCHVEDDAVLDHTPGKMYSVEGHPLCDVFVGNDGSGIMFEPVGESREGSLERQRKIESSANSICSLYSVLEERAAEKGVILKRVYMESASIEEMCVQTDVSRKNRKNQKKTNVQKQRTLDLEG